MNNLCVHRYGVQDSNTAGLNLMCSYDFFSSLCHEHRHPESNMQLCNWVSFNDQQIKVKFTLGDAVKAQRGSRDITLLFP